MARRGPFVGRHDPYMTPAEEHLDYPEARKCLMGYEDQELANLYQQTVRDSLDRMFGHNACKTMRLVVDELHARGIREIPNIFGPIEVKYYRR